ncbi:MAG: nucleotidyltransferase domain-containing protein [Armatimonadota bacterium]
MPSRSSSSASSIYRDRGAILEALGELARQAVRRHPQLERVTLFGSLARGDYGLYSDADLLLVLKESEHSRYFDRIPEFLDDFVRAPVPVELFPYTEDELARMTRDGNPFIARMLSEGVVMAGAGDEGP